jgi:hypothetical protein
MPIRVSSERDGVCSSTALSTLGATSLIAVHTLSALVCVPLSVSRRIRFEDKDEEADRQKKAEREREEKSEADAREGTRGRHGDEEELHCTCTEAAA